MTAFAIDLIAANYGVTEKYFIDQAFKGRENLINKLSELGREDKTTTRSFIDIIEMNLSRIHNVVFPPHDRKGNYQYVDPNYRINEITEGMTGIVSAVENHFNIWRINQGLAEPYYKSEIDDQFQFSKTTMNYIVQRVLDMYSNIFQFDFNTAVYNRVINSTPAFMLNGGILDFITYYKGRDISRDVAMRYQKDDFSDEVWDNSLVTQYIHNVVRAEVDKPALSSFQASMRKKHNREWRTLNYYGTTNQFSDSGR